MLPPGKVRAVGIFPTSEYVHIHIQPEQVLLVWY